MSIAEAALYGDLVMHLRDVCAQHLAALKGVSVDSERVALDEMIRAWFFTLQDDLHGFTPQRVIRNEELNIGNTIPSDKLGDLFEDDCSVCAAMRAEAEASLAANPDHDHGWCFHLAPESSLLDEYDPEGADKRWCIEDERMATNRAARKAEARALPFVGADDPDLADIQRGRARLVDDNWSINL